MTPFEKLIRAVRELSPQGSTSIQGVPGSDEDFVCTVSVLSVILVRSKEGPLDEVILETSSKIDEIVLRMRAFLASV